MTRLSKEKKMKSQNQQNEEAQLKYSDSSQACSFYRYHYLLTES